MMMTVLVTNDTPPAVRGLLKRWFIEPKPHVFVGTVNKRIRDRVLEYVRRNAPDIGILVISSDNSCQGFSLSSLGETDRRQVHYCGVQLIAEKWDKEDT